MNAAIENSHATVVNKCFWILCILLVSSNPVMAFNSSYFKKTGDALGDIQQLLTGITTFRLPLIDCHRLVRHF